PVAGYLKGIAARGAQLVELLAADAQDFTELLLGSLVHVVLCILPAHSTPLSSAVSHREHGETHLSRRGIDSDSLAHAVPEDGTAYGALIADAALHGVGLLGTDYLILYLIVLIDVQQLDIAAEMDGVSIQLGLLDYLGVLDEHLHLGYLRVELTLLCL